MNIENDIIELIIGDASDDEIVKKTNEITALKESLKNLNNCKNIYDIDGNKLNEDDMKNFKKVAMALYKKAYFNKEKDIVNVELVVVHKDGTVITYFKPKEGYNYYKKQKEGKKK